jgi:hypothetical protein
LRRPTRNGANKYENFENKVVKRSEIHFADYNPRVITDSARNKLKKWFKENGKGQLAPITVNQRTMNVVSGHQRLSVLDMLLKYPENDYNLTVAMTDLDEKTEVEANVFMNNKSAQGDFDYDMLGQLHDIFPDISFTDDFGFDESEVSLMLNDKGDDIAAMMGDSPEVDTVVQEAKQFKADDYHTNRKKELNKIKDNAKTDGSIDLEKDDFMITIVCKNNEEKHAIMKLMHEKETEKYIKSFKLYDIYDHKIKLRELS